MMKDRVIVLFDNFFLNYMIKGQRHFAFHQLLEDSEKIQDGELQKILFYYADKVMSICRRKFLFKGLILKEIVEERNQLLMKLN